MPRYIDIDAFRKEHRMNEHCEDCERNARECQYSDFSMMDFCGWLDDAPTVDAAPVVHGKWEGEEYSCSNCHENLSSIMDGWSYFSGGFNGTPYCPYCGAKMDLEGLDAKKET